MSFDDEVDERERKSNLKRSAILCGDGNNFHRGFYDDALPVRI